MNQIKCRYFFIINNILKQFMFLANTIYLVAQICQNEMKLKPRQGWEFKLQVSPWLFQTVNAQHLKSLKVRDYSTGLHFFWLYNKYLVEVKV